MDYQLAITRNREALQRIIAVLFSLVGLVGGGVLDLLPRRVYRAVLLVLRPAESAMRRLIMIAAHGLVVAPRLVRPFTAQIVPSTDRARIPAFQLIDPLKRFSASVESVEDSWIDDIEDINAKDYNAFENNALPRISVPGYSDPVLTMVTAHSAEDLINAQHLGHRLAALKRALENIPREAKRLARWQARRGLALKQSKPIRHSPFRHGRPPGFRARQIHEVDGILRECHALMFDRLTGPDTS